MPNENLQHKEPVNFESTLTYHDDRYEELLNEMGIDEKVDKKYDDRPSATINPQSVFRIISSKVMAFKA